MNSSSSAEEQKTVKRARGLGASVLTICTRSATRQRKKILLEEGAVEDADLGRADIYLPFKINRGHVLVQLDPLRCKLVLTIYHPEAQPFCPLKLKSSLKIPEGNCGIEYWLEMAAVAMQAFSLYAVTKELLPDGDATRIRDDEIYPWRYVRYRSVTYWYDVGLRNIDQLDRASVHLSYLCIRADDDHVFRISVTWQSVPRCFTDADRLQLNGMDMDTAVLSQFTRLKEVSFECMNLQQIPVQLREMALERMAFSDNNIRCVADEDIEPHLGSLTHFRCTNHRHTVLRGENLSVLLGCCMDSLTRTMNVWPAGASTDPWTPRRELYQKVKLYHLLTHGLAAAETGSGDAWSTFLTRGIYDMRLFLFIWSFVSCDY